MHRAFAFSSDSLLIIVNGLPTSRPTTYDELTRKTLIELLDMKSCQICFIDHLKSFDQHLIDAILSVRPRKYINNNEICLINDDIHQLKTNYDELYIAMNNERNEHDDTIIQIERNYEVAERLSVLQRLFCEAKFSLRQLSALNEQKEHYNNIIESWHAEEIGYEDNPTSNHYQLAIRNKESIQKQISENVIKQRSTSVVLDRCRKDIEQTCYELEQIYNEKFDSQLELVREYSKLFDDLRYDSLIKNVRRDFLNDLLTVESTVISSTLIIGSTTQVEVLNVASGGSYGSFSGLYTVIPTTNSSISSANYTIIAPISMAFAFIAIVIAFFILILVSTTKQLHTVSHLLTCNTCLSSILYCTVQCNNYIYLLFIPSNTSDVSCRWRGYFGYTSIVAVIYSYLLQAISRLFFTILSVKYRWITSFEIHFYMIFIGWILVFIIPLPAILTHDIYFREAVPSTCYMLTGIELFYSIGIISVSFAVMVEKFVSLLIDRDIRNILKKHFFGHVASGWESVRTVFEQNLIDGIEIGASLCIYHRGECVVNITGGWQDAKTKKEPYTPDNLQFVFSVSKGIAAAAVALCVEKGWIDYQTPVAHYWPEFGVNGKQDISVSDLIAHRAGLPCSEEDLTLDDVFDWKKITSLLAAQKPYWNPGSGHGYHAYTVGFLVGGLIERVDPQHRSYGQFVRNELDSEFYVGVPDDKVEARVAPLIEKENNTPGVSFPPMLPMIERALTCSGAFSMQSPSDKNYQFNDPRLHRAVVPAVNGISNAHTLARIYALLIDDINENGEKKKCLLSKKTLALATENVTPKNEVDQIMFGLVTTFARGGFQLHDDFFNVLTEDAFGHKGAGGSVAFASPSHHLTLAHVCNQLDFSMLAIDPRTIRFFEPIKNILKEKN
ncbi:hypothetical protein I4U23_004842 [Adineta vaga]|nr:hypothetical protein I4U23_004842 [Adineta vaga]